MNGNLAPFAFDDSLVRAYADEAGNPWFVAKDVCGVLGIEKVRDAVSRLDDDERGSVIVDTLGGPQNVNTISESGLYALVFRSRKPEAKRFRKWVTAEVLPTLRKTGHYAVSGREPGGFGADMPKDVMRLKPALRERLLSDALQAARLEGEGYDTAMRYYAEFCSLVAAAPSSGGFSPDGPMQFEWEATQRYVENCLAPCPGARLHFSEIREHFGRWWKKHHPRRVCPSCRILGSVLGRSAYERYKSGRMVYRDCCILPEGA